MPKSLSGQRGNRARVSGGWHSVYWWFSGGQSDKKPNILVIMGDDRGAAMRAVATTSPQRMLIRDVPEPLISKPD